MKGFIARTLTTACLAGGLAAIGCQTVTESYDRCWPQRYSNTARRAVIDGFAPQVQNGHVLDQTIWNYHFESGTDKLTPGGLEKLDYIVRRRPNPDQNIFLATARDLTYDVAEPDKYADSRRELDARRVASIQRYLQVQMAGRPMQFDVQIHDPYPLSQPGTSAANQARGYQSGATAGASAGGGSTTGGSGQSGQSGASGTGQSGSSSTGSSGGSSSTSMPRQ